MISKNRISLKVANKRFFTAFLKNLDTNCKH